MSNRKITRALISVFYKDNLEPIVHALGKAGVELVSTGGTQEFIEKLGYIVTPVEKLTGLKHYILPSLEVYYIGETMLVI
jgi:phosphoribosylaminoimidazolecarboxamide formyltransferase / IMP cyclohydrolase